MIERIDTDVVIIGAGPAGVISAGLLVQRGWEVIVVEKQRFPRFVIGESLLPRCMDHISDAGLMSVVEKAGFQKKFGALFYHQDKVIDFNFSDQHTEGWTWTWQVPRAEFDKVLADGIENMGVRILYETQVDDVKFNSDNVEVMVKGEHDIQSIGAKYIIDGSGYGRVLPRILGLDEPSDFPVRSALFTHVEEHNRPSGMASNRITIYALSNDVWIWSIPFSNGITSVGFVGNPNFFASVTEQNREEVFRELFNEAPLMKKCFGKNPFVFEPQMITGYAVGVKRLYGERYVLTGNSTEFLDPVFSSGVTFAMESGALAARLVDKELNGKKVKWEEEYTSYIRQGVDTFRSYVLGWYSGALQDIFFANELNGDFKKQICSVLAGYVWDKSNPFVKKHKTILVTLNTIFTQKLV